MKTLLLACAVAFLPASLVAAGPPVPYPDGYRNWTHVKSMVIEEGHPLFDAFGGIHHLYANGAAMEGYREGRFADGAVIVFDLLEVNTAEHAVTEGDRKVLGVMHKDRSAYKKTGGWGFEGFAAGDARRRVVEEEAERACFQCHTSQQDRGFVFSSWRE